MEFKRARAIVHGAPGGASSYQSAGVRMYHVAGQAPRHVSPAAAWSPSTSPSYSSVSRSSARPRRIVDPPPPTTMSRLQVFLGRVLDFLGINIAGNLADPGMGGTS